MILFWLISKWSYSYKGDAPAKRQVDLMAISSGMVTQTTPPGRFNEALTTAAEGLVAPNDDAFDFICIFASCTSYLSLYEQTAPSGRVSLHRPLLIDIEW